MLDKTIDSLISFLSSQGVSVKCSKAIPKMVKSWNKRVFDDEVIEDGKIYIETAAGFYIDKENSIWLNMNEVEAGTISIEKLVVHELCHWLCTQSSSSLREDEEEILCLRAEKEAIAKEPRK